MRPIYHTLAAAEALAERLRTENDAQDIKFIVRSPTPGWPTTAIIEMHDEDGFLEYV